MNETRLEHEYKLVLNEIFDFCLDNNLYIIPDISRIETDGRVLSFKVYKNNSKEFVSEYTIVFSKVSDIDSTICAVKQNIINALKPIYTMNLSEKQVKEIIAEYLMENGYTVVSDDVSIQLEERLVGFRTDNEYETYFKGVKVNYRKQ
jgi:hypothetical protein